MNFVLDQNEHTDTAWVCYILCGIYVLLIAVAYQFSSAVDSVLCTYSICSTDGKLQDISGVMLSLKALTSIFVDPCAPIYIAILLVFGDNIEYMMGRLRFTAFFLLCGFLSVWGGVFVSTMLTLPGFIGSGAVWAVLGAYARIFPKKKVSTYFWSWWYPIFWRRYIRPLGHFWYAYEVRARTYLAYMFLFSVIVPVMMIMMWNGDTQAKLPYILLANNAIGFVLGYLIAPLFRDSEIVVYDRDEKIDEKIEYSSYGKPVIQATPKKNFSYYNGGAIDPTFPCDTQGIETGHMPKADKTRSGDDIITF